ncbi:MAG: biotin--[acetyl-CoA-carboxylase] ligase [Thermoproteota archaeon]|nr:biotin--[acetyl-CoA-carboxylase] ligase [Thermoproteota archaeon]
MIVQSIGKKMKTKLIGRQIYYYEELGSTQELAIYLAENNSEAVNGTAILAERQDRGRGRINSKWISPSGGIWLSIILKPNMPANKSPLLKFIAALAVCDTIAQNTGLESKVKWPNDILINHKKVCGILLDIATKGSSIEYAVIGIGINANVNIRKILPYIPDHKGNDVSVTSLKSELSGKYVNRPSFLKLLFERLEHYYCYLEKEDLGGMVILNQINDRLDILNAVVTIQQTDKTIEGLVVGLGLDGSLVLKKNDGSLIEVLSGDTRSSVLKQQN